MTDCTLSQNEKPDLIVSLTTWKPRIQSGSFLKSLESIISQDFPGKFKIVLTLFKDDEKFLSKEQRDFLNKNGVEIFVSNINLRPHLKYFFTMQRYRKFPIVTVDDDNVYSRDLLKTLFDDYRKFGNKYVYSCRTHRITRDKDGNVQKYRSWKFEDFQEEPSFDMFATGVGGVLYPPDILKISSSDIPDIVDKSLTTDDLFLKSKENQLGIKVKSVKIKSPYSVIKTEYAAKHALCISENTDKNDINIRKLGLGKKNSKNDIEIILRVCDKVESVHGKREFGTKDGVIRKCFPTLCEAIRVYEKEKPGSVGLTVVRDNLRKETSDFLKEQLESREIKFKTVDSIPGGNVGSFKTCFDIALKMDENQFVHFLEDDYLCHPEFIPEILGFFGMFDRYHNSVFLNPTTDVGDPGVVEIKGRKYRRATILPSKKGGLGIWWRQTWHSTSTFAAKVGSLLKHKKVFDEIFKQKELNQYKRNTIFSESPCFQPLYPLLQHYQKQKTMYWFSPENRLRDITYLDWLVDTE